MFNTKSLSLGIAGIALAASLALPVSATEVFVRVVPPRPVVERVVSTPGPRYVWVGGYYRWTGHVYAWVPGRWVYPPRPAAVWVAPHWNFVAGRRGYVFVGGYWR